MKTCIVRNQFLLPVVIAGLVMMLVGQLTAQTFTTLHSFTGDSTNSDGAVPTGSLILSGNTLYGNSLSGGFSGYGTVFKVNTDGTGFRTLYSFSGGSDGGGGSGGLVLTGNILYGTTDGFGTSGNGTVFAVNTDGTGFTNLHSFTANSGGHPPTNSDGAHPSSGLILSGNTLYGTTEGGGTSGGGTVFRVNTDGTGFTTVHAFTLGSDGAGPYGALVLSDTTLYGTTVTEGGGGAGTVFAVNTDGTGFANLHSFSFVDSDGQNPRANLILSSNTLYGTTYYGGSSGNGNGTVFKVNTDGTGFAVLHSFTETPPFPGPYANSDGANPEAGLILSGNTLYGPASYGGTSGYGTVFKVNTDGTDFASVYSFTEGSNGPGPSGGLILSDNTLYGTTYYGGSAGSGTVFSLSFPPQLSSIPSGSNFIVMWPTNYAGFDYTGYILQATINLGSTAVWTTVSPSPAVVNGQNTVTNPIAGTQQFYRLSRQ